MAYYHTFITLLVPAIVSFVTTYIATRFLMGYFYSAGIVEEDRNKGKPVLLPSSCGLAATFGTIIGILTYAFGMSFLVPQDMVVLRILKGLFAVSLSLLLISLVGLLDDINVKRKMVNATGIKSYKQGLKQWQKPALTVIGAIPLVAINAGVSVVRIPFLGTVNLGLWYPFLILPLAIIFASNAVNLLGGFDGLQTGMGLAAVFGFLVYSVFYGNHIGALLSAVLFASLLAFTPFNFGKVIPGDSFTYMLGAGLVSIAVLGNAEAFGLIVFMPWIVEFFLHARRKFKVSDLGIRQKDGTFKAPYGKKIYSLTHLFMNIKPMKEREVSLYLTLFELLFVALAFLMKAYGLL
jgi:UDP-N-acetylglucosamine--dolichyl-phosphate N-acetylglucosaminephosphotransferase